MPISKKEFNEKQLIYQVEQLRNFLELNKDKGWRAEEISKELKIKKEYIENQLVKLKQKGFVNHKRPFWIWNDKK